MSKRTYTSREFNQRVSEAKKTAEGDTVVFITDRGAPAHVLMSIEKYNRLVGTGRSIVDMLAMPEAADIEFEITRSKELPREVDLS
ncbi:type II toxin-antitoxin system Phd/YefM family antitoxin [Diaphorobacter sp. HDW4A]|uniref:type II toxin-antitoxin system Phd/YefM family antitoxin n=1 Tax=Diaphorobacter sp. HDW4A TaxID=2714924 RepID=UPI00140AA357|nr:type II toxin-antitoxin system Phd/YefM family antitoxin [Diaphorobacter sp. HDW4A]QIL82775.1 type II toxin-antitoxin system Phd/YefM family antitoxin [Diaphorobacter sp. HDW4A]